MSPGGLACCRAGCVHLSPPSGYQPYGQQSGPANLNSTLFCAGWVVEVWSLASLVLSFSICVWHASSSVSGVGRRCSFGDFSLTTPFQVRFDHLPLVIFLVVSLGLRYQLSSPPSPLPHPLSPICQAYSVHSIWVLCAEPLLGPLTSPLITCPMGTACS